MTELTAELANVVALARRLLTTPSDQQLLLLDRLNDLDVAIGELDRSVPYDLPAAAAPSPMTADILPIYDDHGQGCPARAGLGDCDEKVRVTLSGRLCAICGDRRGELIVLMDDIPTDLCETCYAKGDEEARDGD